MSHMDDRLQIQWLVACLSPGDIAPHPNFRADAASDTQLLALIAKLQWREYATYRYLDGDNNEDSPSTDAKALLDAARRSLEAPTIRDGLSDLLVVARNEDLPFGQRAAAALFAANASSELDEPAAHLELLENIANSVSASSEGATSSRGLAAAILLQQCALRSYEAGDPDSSRSFAGLAASILRDINDDWDEFSVSPGISWSAIESQTRLAELIEGNARSLLITTGNHSDTAWKDIVRAPFPAAATRPTRDVATALTAIVDDYFRQAYPSSRRTQTIGGEGDVELSKLYSALLCAELSGNLGETARYRQLIGDVISIRLSSGDPDAILQAEAIRLLRQSDSIDNLKRLLRSFRMNGSLNLVKSAAAGVIEIRERRQSYITSSDLALLDNASDLLDPEDVRRATDLAVRYAGQDRDGRVRGSRPAHWKRLETALRTINALAAGGVDRTNVTYIARAVLRIADISNSAGDQFVLAALAKLAGDIHWDEVPNDTKEDWLQILRAAIRSPDVRAIHLLRFQSALKTEESSEIRRRLDGLDFVGALVGDLLGEPPASSDVDKAVASVITTIETIQRDASKGSFVGYAWSPFALAAGLIIKFSRYELWPVLLAALNNPLVPADGKLDALQVLSANAHKVPLPDAASAALIARPLTVGATNPNVLFSVRADVFAAARRNFYLAYGLTTPADVQESTLRDAGGDPLLRSNAARTCLIASTRAPQLEWPQVLLLQLSHDRDATVRNIASEGLAYTSVVSRVVMRRAVAERVESLLSEDGIAIVMGVLQGLAEAANHELSVDRPLWCENAVAALSRRHSSRNVQRASRDVLDLYSSS